MNDQADENGKPDTSPAALRKAADEILAAAADADASFDEINEGGPAEPDPFQVLLELQKENLELKDKALRAIAEAENTRRRAMKEKEDAQRYGAQRFGGDMVQVSDNLRRAIAALKPEDREAAPEAIKALIDGVEATERQLLAAFERHGIKEITPQAGDRFDAHMHEAMFEVPNSGHPAGSVVHVIEAGYMIGDRLLRAARVGVAKGDDASQPHVDIKA
ncbi:MAG: nucleotide exchange factor GrpE [Parvibaculaceae bacterium]